MTDDRPLLRMIAVDDERGASTRHRVLLHRGPLEGAGWRVDVGFPLRPGYGPRSAWRFADLVRDCVFTRDADVLFIHRKTFPPPFARLIRNRSRPIVFDVDDAIDLPPPSLSADDATLVRYRKNFEAIAHVAALVICGNAELARRVPHERTVLLPTPVAADRFRPGAVPPPSGPTVGWVGHSDNLVYLERLLEPLREVARRHPGLRVVVAADRPPHLPGLEVEFRRWTLDGELDVFGGMTVGLMPLDDTPWARAKCSFKALQYMALAIPAVASPVGMNVDVIETGRNGFLADRPARWVEVLDALLSDGALAQRIGAAGRRTVEKSFAANVVSARLIEILAAVRENRSP